MGYPLVSVEERGGKLVISQKRFIFDGSLDKDGLSWKVPLTYVTKDGAGSFLLEAKSASIASPVKEGGWVKFNPGQTGFYRVRYSQDLLARLRDEIRSGRLSDTDALGILDDVSSFVRSGELSAIEVLEVLSDFRSRTDYNIWIVAAGILGSVENLLPAGPAADAYHRFCRGLFEGIWEKLGWEAKPSDRHSDKLLRAAVIGRLGHYGEVRVIEEAKKRFAAGNITPDLRSAVFGIVAEHGDEGDWNKLRSMYKGTDHQEEKVRLLRAFTRFRDPRAVADILQFALSGDVRPQDAYVILAGFGSNSAARRACWGFIQANWKKLTDRYKSGSVGLLGHILEGSTCGFSDRPDERAVSAFFRAHPVPGTERTRAQTLEMIRSNIVWKQRDLSKLLSWLRDGFLLK
jgi:aminopeptidase N